jgi:predicted PurR-regulated permease PerM
MNKKYIYIIAGAVLFVLSIVYIVWNQTNVINKIFIEHRESLQREIDAIKNERLILKRTIDSLELKINSEKKDLLFDIDNFLKSHDKK